MQCSAVLCSAVPCCAVLCCAVLCCAVLSALQCSLLVRELQSAHARAHSEDRDLRSEHNRPLRVLHGLHHQCPLGVGEFLGGNGYPDPQVNEGELYREVGHALHRPRGRGRVRRALRMLHREDGPDDAGEPDVDAELWGLPFTGAICIARIRVPMKRMESIGAKFMKLVVPVLAFSILGNLELANCF